MQMFLKKSAAILSILAVSLYSLSCGSTDNTDTQTQTVTTDTPETVDFGGKEYRMLIRREFEYEFNSPEETGDVLNDALYDRNQTIEDTYNINIVTTAEPGDWDSQEEFMGKVRNTISAGDDAYDIIAGYAAMMPPLIPDGLYYNLNDLPHLDFGGEWWSRGLYDTFNINDRCYVMSGSISLSLWENTWALYYNKDVAEQFGITGIYDEVNSGTWTFDRMKEYCQLVTADINGDSVSDQNDRWGYVTDHAPEFDFFADIFDVDITSIGDNGLPTITVDNERNNDILVAVNDFLFSGSYALPYDDEDDKAVLINMFKTGLTLFEPMTFGMSTLLRGMESDFGIIPFPKYDENQARYQTTSKDDYTMLAVPVTITDLEFVGLITEAMCKESHESVIPVFYDTVLKTKNARDDETAEMIDLIYSGLHYDFAYANSISLDWSGHIFAHSIRDKKTNISTEYASKKDAMNEQLNALLDIYLN